jgi:hypothetical protein
MVLQFCSNDLLAFAAVDIIQTEEVYVVRKGILQ